MRVPGFMTTLYFSLSTALFFGLLELLKAVRSGAYMGETASEWLGLGLACFFYALVLLLFSLTALAYARLKRNHRADALIPPVVLSGGMLLAGLLLWHRGDGFAAADFGVFGVILLLGLHYVVLRGFFSIQPRAISLLWAGIWIPGALVAVAWGHATLLDAGRARTVLLHTGGWVLLCGAVLTLVWIFTALKARRRKMLRLFCAVWLLALSLAFFPAAEALRRPAKRVAGPSVLLITCDALRKQSLSVYGGPVETPAMERLARDGVCFTNARVIAPWTVPSMLSMFASDHVLPVDRDVYIYPPDTPVPAELFRDAGYHTGAFLGNWLLAKRPCVSRGWDHAEVWNHTKREVRTPFRLAPFFEDMVCYWFPDAFPERPVDTSRRITAMARAFLRRHAGGSFFLWLHYMDPHDPWDPPNRYRSRETPWPWYPHTAEGDVATDRIDRNNTPVLQAIRTLYRGEVGYLDEAIGRVLDAMEAHGIYRDTCTVLLNDHGEELGGRGRLFHGHSLFGEQVCAPLLIAGPEIPASKETAAMVSNLDVIPTLAAMAGLPAAASWRGRNLLPLMRGGDFPPARDLLLYGTADWKRPIHRHALVKGPWKLIETMENNTDLLFNLYEDADEKINIAPEEPEKHRALRGLLETEKAAFMAPEISPTETQIKEMQEALEAVGYVQ
jgi:arylsulfatase